MTGGRYDRRETWHKLQGTAEPAAAFQIQAAYKGHGPAINGLSTPADGHIQFQPPDYDCTIENIYHQSSSFKCKGRLGIARSGSCLEEHESRYGQQVTGTEHPQRWHRIHNQIRDVGIYPDDIFREQREQKQKRNNQHITDFQ